MQLTYQPLLIVACALIIAAFLVAGLLIQHEHDTRESIASQVDRNRAAHQVSHQVAVPAPSLSVLDGGAPLPSIALIPAATPATPSASSIPDETRIERIGSIGSIGDIAEQPTQIISAADMATIASATAARDHVPPQILEAFGGRWILALPWALPDNALN